MRSSPSSLCYSKNISELIWVPEIWEDYPVSQMPIYADKKGLNNATQQLKRKPALVSYAGVVAFRKALDFLSVEPSFFLQIGDCVEVFERNHERYALRTLTFLETLYRLFYEKTSVRPVIAGRLAGQFAKPRSSLVQELPNNERNVPSFHGDMVNGLSVDKRDPDPRRMLTAYTVSRLIKHHIQSKLKNRCVAKEESNVLQFEKNFFFSHEAYFLPYETGLCRRYKNAWYASSAHNIWVGDRTRSPSMAHVQFVRGLKNAIGVKVGPTAKINELLDLIQLVNPLKEENKLIFIFRLGWKNIENLLPCFIQALRFQSIIWVCDPMHGNTKYLSNGYKTRFFEEIKSECIAFFRILSAYGIKPQGLHIEASPETIAECFDPKRGIDEDAISNGYASSCDPRLNQAQAEELVALCAQLIAL